MLLKLVLYVHRLDEIQYLELFQAKSVIDQNMNISVSLSMNSEVMLDTGLFIASVITFGIEGDCILEELIVNASIDDILYGEYAIVINNFIS